MSRLQSLTCASSKLYFTGYASVMPTDVWKNSGSQSTRTSNTILSKREKEKVSITALLKYSSPIFGKVRDDCHFCICMLQASGTTGDGEDWLLLIEILKDFDK